MGIRFLDPKREVQEKKKAGVKFVTPASLEPLTLDQRIKQEQIETERKENPIQSALFPRLTEAKLGHRKSEEVSTALDLLSLPGRAIAATLGRDKDEEFLQSLAKIEDDGFLWDIVRDPATGATVLTLPAGGAAGFAAKSLPKLKALSALTGIGIAEGIVGAGTSQTERLTEGEEFQPGQFALETAASGAMPLGQKLIGGLIRGGNKLFGKLASEATGIPEEALRVYSRKGGKEALKKASGQELAIGEELIETLDNFDKYIPEREMVNEALEQMPQMKLVKLKVFIERQKIKPIKGVKLSDSQIAVNRELQNLSNRLGKGKNIPVEKSISAKDFKTLRQQIDDDINFEKLGPRAYGTLNDKMFKIRTYMKNELLEGAKTADPEGLLGYETAMKAWSEKLKIKESLDDVLGGKAVNKRQRAANIMGNIFSKNNKVKYNLVKKLDDLTNKNFIERSGLSELAEKLGPEGIPSILPPQKTGAALKGIGAGSVTGQPLLGLGISSPALSAKTMRLIDLAETGSQLQPASTLGGIITRESLRRGE